VWLLRERISKRRTAARYTRTVSQSVSQSKNRLLFSLNTRPYFKTLKSGHRTNKNMVMCSGGASNQERLCCRKSAASFCSIRERSLCFRNVSKREGNSWGPSYLWTSVSETHNVIMWQAVNRSGQSPTLPWCSRFTSWEVLVGFVVFCFAMPTVHLM
jgi:hypothetical protein